MDNKNPLRTYKKLDVNQSMIAKIESGKYNPSFKKAYELTRNLEKSYKQFVDMLDTIEYNLLLIDNNSVINNMIEFSTKKDEIDYDYYKTNNKKDNGEGDLFIDEKIKISNVG